MVGRDRLPHPHRQITDERRQEFILLSDVLGLSMLTIGFGAPSEPEATVFGPFFVRDAPVVELGGDVAQGGDAVTLAPARALHR